MIAPLRKRHFRIWLVIGAILPFLTISAYLMAPQFPRDDFYEQRLTFPELLRSQVSERYVFNIKKNYAGGTMLEIVHISKYNPASELVTISYHVNYGKETMRKTLGMMGGQTTYLFNLKEIVPPFTVTVTDTLNHALLAEIDF
ncbi:MAG: hypothetical protein K1X61_10010 [Chitinophagales bacterium]|nr:hypothetical protein [Chitinophagales bacterium]